MITETTLAFLRNLKSNNNRPWFQEHRQEYDAAAADFFDTVVRLIGGIAAFDSGIASFTPDPKRCIMRIYRDIRFSADKTPYKTGFFAYVNSRGWKAPEAGYYLHLEPGASFTGAGLYMPASDLLVRTRRAIDQRFEAWQSIVSSPQLLEAFPEGVRPSGLTQRPPKGYDASNPAIAWLRYKGYYTQHHLDDRQVTAPDFPDMLVGLLQTALPMVSFLNRALDVEANRREG